MNYIKKMIQTFVMILAGTTIGTTIFITIFYPNLYIDVQLLWQIIVMSAVSALGNLIFYSRREYGKKQIIIRKIIHFVYTFTVVLGGAFLWRWITPGIIIQIIVMVIFLSTIYAVIMYVSMKNEEKTAKAMNNSLSKFNSEEAKKESES